MNAMDKLFKLLLAAAAALFFTGCYSDYLNPGPARVYTRADFEAKGLEYISVGELKARFRAENAGMNDGTVASWTVDEPLFTSGKVISTDRFGNVYKSVYLYDEASESAIELKLNTGNYLFHPVGQIVYVDLEGLVLGTTAAWSASVRPPTMRAIRTTISRARSCRTSTSFRANSSRC